MTEQRASQSRREREEPPFPRTSPADGSALEEVRATSIAEIPALLGRARAAQAEWAAEPIERRIRAASKVKARILERAEAIAALVHSETGKPEVEALLGEALPSADVIAYWAENIADELEPSEVQIDGLAYPKKRGFTRREPRGVVALVSPWNFPFALPLRTIVPALLAGNAVVFKPSEHTPRTGALLAELFADALPPGLLTVVQGGADAGAAVVEGDVDVVVFTGSTATGKRIAHACAERLIPCSLELGGKDAAIVLADADLDRASSGIVWGAMMNSGQNCASIERVFVEKPVAEKLTEKIVAQVKALRPGRDIGAMTTEAQRALVARHVAEAKAAGGEILVGGAPQGQGFEPTVVKIGAVKTPLLDEETFGPVVPITEVASAAEAIERANASAYALTTSIWSDDIGKAEALAGRLRSGVVTINNHGFTGALPAAPWGGTAASGWGITGSPFALGALTRPRFLLVDRNPAPRESWWFPYSPALRTLAVAIAALRSGKASALLAVVGALRDRSRELRTGAVRGE